MHCTPLHSLQLHYAQAFRLFSQILNGILTTACVLVGTVGNLHSVKSVHFANFDKNQGIVLAVSIVALAFWDTILLWCAFFYYGLKNIDPTAQNSDLVNLITPWFHAFSQIANTASVSSASFWSCCSARVAS